MPFFIDETLFFIEEPSQQCLPLLREKKRKDLFPFQIFFIDEAPFLQKNLTQNAFLWYIDNLNTMHVVVGWPIVATRQIQIFWSQIVIHSIFAIYFYCLPRYLKPNQHGYFQTHRRSFHYCLSIFNWVDTIHQIFKS